MKIHSTKLVGLILLEPQVFGDERGFFKETWNEKDYASTGVPKGFVQDNLSKSPKGVLRGLHFQNPNAQGKLVSVMQGEVNDVVVDIRKDSITFGHWEGFILSGENHLQLFIPPGFAHGFSVLKDNTYFQYKCTEYYHPECEHSLLWNDPELNIDWKLENPIVSEKDSQGLLLKQLDEKILNFPPPILNI